MLTLLWRRGKLPLLIAPRGEFNPGALSIKSWKKSLYLNLIGRLITRSKYVFWHGTNNDECKQLNKLVNNSRKVFTARNIPSVVSQKNQTNDIDTYLRIVSVGRVCEMKNIDFALRVLHEVKCPVTYDIIGNIEDANYWSRCSRLIDTLPQNVTVNILGPIEHDDVIDRLNSAHLFFSPTQGENFGHAIVEALQMGCPVLISDMTPWKNLHERQAGWDLPLCDEHAYVKKIQWMFDNKQEFEKFSIGARNYAKDVLEKLPSVSEHVQMFERVLKA
ncbi:glycosyltransferase [Akkermansiaceae bacterium]|nr:glycosyltransferase [Akkermansiaceae bacterium]